MERGPADRAAFVREACAGDEGLRREVESLLDYECGADALLERPAAAVAAPMLNHSASSSVLTGRQIGPYQIGALLGAGGMGEVYRARDTQLNREVALKVLPAGFTADPDRLARFRREAQVLASLNHPNIAAIHGFEEADGVRALVLELVDGPTLADLIARGPIPLDDALPVARQVAEALEAAHDRGIIHRDLKPANVKVTSEGTVKVLDFGLAKLVVPDPVGSGTTQSASQSPTITSPALLTGAGVILGTAAYMSPEQAKGREADRRGDVWAFGCVLYEMLAGKRAFPGDDLTETLAAVIKSDPDWTGLPPAVPPSIHRLLRRCLHKDRKARLGDASSLCLEIDDARNHAASGRQPAPPAPRWRLHLTWAAATSVLVLAAGALAWILRSPQAIPEVRFTIPTRPTRDPASLAISPDGQKLVFEAVTDGRSQLWLRELRSTTARPLARTDDARRPFWSFDGRAVGFSAAGKLKWLDLDGGTVHSLADVPSDPPRGGAWNRDGVIVFQNTLRGWFVRASPSSDEPVALPRPPELNSFVMNPRGPQFLPDGARFMYLGNADEVFLTSLDGLPPRRLFTADRTPVYASGHLFFVRQETLFAQPFDPGRLSLGDPTPLAEDVGAVVAAESPGGVLLAFRSSFRPSLRQLAWVDRAGNVTEKIGEAFASGSVGPALSPDGKTVALTRTDLGSASELGLLDITRPVFARFTFDPFISAAPVFSPDGSRIVFQTNPKGVADLYQREISGAGKEELLLETPEPKMPSDWHGRFLLYHSRFSTTTGWDLWALPMDGTRQPFAIAQSAYDERNAVFSPDGKWIAYQSNESGRHEIYVQSFPGPGVKKTISTSGGAQARWRPDGKELFYIDLEDRLMAVPIRLDPDGRGIDPGDPVPLFATHVGGAVQTLGRQQYFVPGDGTRFLMCLSTQEPVDAPITVILNWKPKR